MSEVPSLTSVLGRPARIGMVTPWGQVCGIAQYTENMVAALRNLGHDVRVVANYPYEPLTHPDEQFVTRCFEIELRTTKNFFKLDDACAALRDCDLIHVQGESALFSKNYLPALQSALSNKRFLITHHSTCSPVYLPTMRFHVAHNEKVLDDLSIRRGQRATHPMPSPMVDYVAPPVLGDTLVLRSYGLGRNHDEIVNQAVEQVNKTKAESDPKIRFETHYGHHKWLPFHELLKWIQAAHACILYYPPVGAQVTSSAAYLALGCGRPLVVSNTNWFSTLASDKAIFAGFSGGELYRGLMDLVVNYQQHVSNAREYAEWLTKNRSYIAVAKVLEAIYIETLS